MKRSAINTGLLRDYMRAEGIASYYALARRMGVSHSTVYRVVNGKAKPGERFYPGLRRAFPGRDTGALIR